MYPLEEIIGVLKGYFSADHAQHILKRLVKSAERSEDIITLGQSSLSVN